MMMDTKKDYGKLHLILELIDRKDIREALNENFSKEEQNKLFQTLKDIMADEITFVMNIKKM
jgi:hypothetical protein